jgi:hypothetical protein
MGRRRNVGSAAELGEAERPGHSGRGGAAERPEDPGSSAVDEEREVVVGARRLVALGHRADAGV